jgi:hypothetical protein
MKTLRVIFVPVLILLLGAPVLAQESASNPGLGVSYTLTQLQSGEDKESSESEETEYKPSFGDWIISTNLHKITGYVTLGLVTATAIAGPLGLTDIHPILGYTTLGTALTNSVLGIIAYGGLIDYVWPHLLFNALGEVGLILNAFVWQPGSTEHIITGVASAVSFAAGYVSIILLTR